MTNSTAFNLLVQKNSFFFSKQKFTLEKNCFYFAQKHEKNATINKKIYVTLKHGKNVHTKNI
jgi:hypothetical protein